MKMFLISYNGSMDSFFSKVLYVSSSPAKEIQKEHSSHPKFEASIYDSPNKLSNSSTIERSIKILKHSFMIVQINGAIYH